MKYNTSLCSARNISQAFKGLGTILSKQFLQMCVKVLAAAYHLQVTRVVILCRGFLLIQLALFQFDVHFDITVTFLA